MTSNDILLNNLEHSVIEFQGKKIIVCNGHFCDRDGEEVKDE
jgi:hypothetical protein